MRYKNIILIILFLSSGIFYYNITGHSISEEVYTVTRVLDGDTVELDGSIRVRLIGINAPEKNQLYGDESTIFLKSLIENRSVKIENHGADRYGRTLGYIFVGKTNINKKLVEEGLAHTYYYQKDKHYKSLMASEEFARINQKGIWKKSPDHNCLTLIELKYKEEPKRCTNNERLILQNVCSKELEIIIKDDATHVYKEKIPPNSIFEKNFSCIWNDAGDTVYVWDSEGLMLFYRY